MPRKEKAAELARRLMTRQHPMLLRPSDDQDRRLNDENVIGITEMRDT